MTNNTTLETVKKDRYSVDAICKMIDDYTINFSHPAQRESDQWNAEMKSNLVSDILQGNGFHSLIMAEQIINGTSVIWNLDGKQRCTNVYSYLHDGYKIAKSVARNIIRYQTNKLDENGNPIFVDGIIMKEWKEFDIVNKKFSQLPVELQKKFINYCFDIELYINCSSEDIIYHIGRYNSGKPMNKSQKGIIKLGEDFCSVVKSISKLPFFVDCGSYTLKEDKNGTINRVVAESVMAANFFDDWKHNSEQMCQYLCDNANIDMFDDMQDTIERLTDIVEDEHDELFTSKDSFIWFTVFTRFKDNGYDDDEFAKFLTKFVNEMQDIEIDGDTFNTLKENRSTKDKNVISKKINYIETLLKQFLN